MKSMFVMMVLVFSSIGVFAQKDNIPIIQPQPSPPPVTNPIKPYSQVRINVEAWLEDNILTIQFHNSEGDATITLNCRDDSSVEFTFSSDTSIIIDLNPYEEVHSFNIRTTIGKYKGNL
ncbi:MAG: hypothetical protein K2K95_00475 [Muribaculaceae bacterium]|nr:hypothetical protein [Muribaculaceae bacterium]